MRSNEFLDRFGENNAVFSRSDAEQRAMRLRDALLTPRGARGPHAPHLEPVHMARLLISLTASGTAPGGADVVAEYAKMGAIGERYAGCEDFEAALTAIFSADYPDENLSEVSVCRSWPEASITMKDGTQFTFSTLDPPAYEKRQCRLDFKVGWHFFHSIVSALHSGEGGWTGEATGKSKAYDKWIKQAGKIHTETGKWAAADKWMQDNPFVDNEG